MQFPHMGYCFSWDMVVIWGELIFLWSDTLLTNYCTGYSFLFPLYCLQAGSAVSKCGLLFFSQLKVNKSILQCSQLAILLQIIKEIFQRHSCPLTHWLKLKLSALLWSIIAFSFSLLIRPAFIDHHLFKYFVYTHVRLTKWKFSHSSMRVTTDHTKF